MYSSGVPQIPSPSEGGFEIEEADKNDSAYCQTSEVPAGKTTRAVCGCEKGLDKPTDHTRSCVDVNLYQRNTFYIFFKLSIWEKIKKIKR